MLRPPTSTLFPYTTLFRSSGRGVRSRVTVKAREAQDRSRSRDPSLARVTDLASSRDASRTSRTAPVQDRVERVLPPPPCTHPILPVAVPSSFLNARKRR